VLCICCRCGKCQCASLCRHCGKSRPVGCMLLLLVGESVSVWRLCTAWCVPFVMCRCGRLRQLGRLSLLAPAASTCRELSDSALGGFQLQAGEEQHLREWSWKGLGAHCAVVANLAAACAQALWSAAARLPPPESSYAAGVSLSHAYPTN
jgi:hypothetical protein